MSTDDIDLGRLLYEVFPAFVDNTADLKKHLDDGIQRLSDLGIKGSEIMKEAIDHRDPEHRQKVFEPFHELDQKYVALASQYSDSYEELYKDIEAKTHRREYGKGGGSIQRGYYSPSMIDLVVSNVRRGRLLKKPPKDGKYTYEYLFDESDRLICVYKYGYYDEYQGYVWHDGGQSLASTELFVYEPDKVLSLNFNDLRFLRDGSHDLEYITECKYENGLLTRYEFAVRPNSLIDIATCSQIEVEEFEYVDNQMKVMYWYRYQPHYEVLEKERYVFERDEEGYLSTCTLERLFHSMMGNSMLGYARDRDSGEPIIYDVTVRRK